MENQIIGPILPLRDLVVYPSITSPLFVGRAKSIDAINFAMNNNNKIIYLFTQKEPTTDDPQVNDVYSYGVKSKIIQFLKLPDNTYKVLTEGLEIVKIKSAVKASNNFLTAKIETVVINKKNSVELKASLRVLKNEFQNYIQNIGNNNDILEGLLNIEDPYQFIDNIYYNLNIGIEDKQKNLEIIDINKKIQNLLNFFSKELNFSALEKKIKNRVKRQMEKTQREYYLNEQMKAIQKELGDGEDGSNEYSEIEKKINEVKLSKEAKEKALNEFKKLKSMSPMSAEASVIRNYLEWILDIPWEKFSKEVIDNYELLSIIMRKSFISNIEGEDKVFLNTNKLIERNFYGLKTGWTNDAGLTFIGLNQSNDRNILTIVNKSYVNEKKDNHFVDTQNLYSASIDTFINNVVIDNNVDIYKIRNNFEALTFKSTAPWFVFGNKLDISNITLNEFSETKFNYVVNEDLYNVRISDSVNSVKWDFNLSSFFSFFANNN